jgi:hypothetical protein
MIWSAAWTMPTISSAYMVIKMVTQGTLQLALLGGSANSHYLGGQTGIGVGFDNRPGVYSGSGMKGSWPTALVNATNYLVKWRTDRTVAASCTFATQVNDGAESSEVAAGTSADTFNGMGYGSQDLVSDVAEFVVYNRTLSAGEQQQLWDYFNAKYAIF